MSWKYLQGKTWAQVTRDERFFCQHLYNLINRGQGTKSFIPTLNRLAGLELDANTDWEIGYEVCFYRDLWFLGGQEGEKRSPKRTFDLCLFSSDEIVIVEAKAQQGFDSDRSQKVSFENDKTWVEQLTHVKRVKLLGLASSRYLTNKKRDLLFKEKQDALVKGKEPLFDALIDWKGLAVHFERDEVLLRADSIYDEKRMTFSQILLRIEQREGFYIGCQGGLKKFLGEFRNDLEKRYETSLECKNNNWFPSEEVRKHLSAFSNNA